MAKEKKKEEGNSLSANLLGNDKWDLIFPLISCIVSNPRIVRVRKPRHIQIVLTETRRDITTMLGIGKVPPHHYHLVTIHHIASQRVMRRCRLGCRFRPPLDPFERRHCEDPDISVSFIVRFCRSSTIKISMREINQVNTALPQDAIRIGAIKTYRL